MGRVLITSEYFGKFSDEAVKLITNSRHELVRNPFGHKFLSSDEIIPYVADVDAIICDLEKISRQVIEAAPRLKIISRRGVGVDNVDLKAARERNIVVARTLGVIEDPVVELVITYIMNLGRRICEMNQIMKAHVWRKLECDGITGKTLGIIGMGNIGKKLAVIASALSLNVIYYDLYRNKEFEQKGIVQYRNLPALMAEADFVSLHVPLLESTKNMINADLLRLMKQSAYFINTARSMVVNEHDLYTILKEHKIAGAAIDVFESEPDTESPLIGLDNTIVTPHVGTFTRATFIRMDVLAAQNVLDFFDENNIS